MPQNQCKTGQEMHQNWCNIRQKNARKMPGKTRFFYVFCAFSYLVGFLIFSTQLIYAQSLPSGYAGKLHISVGGMISEYDLSVGSRHLLGYTAFADIDSRRPLGLEVEVRRLEFRQVAQEHAATYSIGMRYHHALGRATPYGKFLVGIGTLNFPYSYAHGRYAAISLGGGVDLRLRQHIDFRGDFEAQRWPAFSFGSMSAYGASVGLRYRIR